jgi:hypothetical protein
MNNAKVMLSKGTEVRKVSDFIEYIRMKWHEEPLVLFRGQASMYFPLDAPIARPDFHPKGDVLEIEKRMFEEFERRSVPFLGTKINNDWDMLALARHHGLPTRLLDWTTSALAALWFAVREVPVKAPNSDDFAYGAVWVFRPPVEDMLTKSDLSRSPLDPKWRQTKIFQPRHVTNRITSQSGWFTVHMYQKGRNKFLALNKIPRLKKQIEWILIPPDKFCKIRLELFRCGINDSVLFPGLDAICSYIKMSNGYLPDEEGIPSDIECQDGDGESEE